MIVLLLLLQVAPRPVRDAVEAAKKDVQAWSKEAALLRALSRGTEVELTYVTKEACPVGESKTRTWTVASELRAGPEKALKTGEGALPETWVDVKAALDVFRKKGMDFATPLLELGVVHGKPLWYTLNPNSDTWVADAVTGEALWVGRAEVLKLVREQTNAVTSWARMVAAVERELKGWKAAGAQLASLRATGLPRKFLDEELGLTQWEVSVFLEKPEPRQLYFRIANGGVAYWGNENVPADRSHHSPLSSWSFAGAGRNLPAHPLVKPFLAPLPRVRTELVADAPRLKTGQALLTIRNVDANTALEIALDRKGAAR
jgi:hypothetical protein